MWFSKNQEKKYGTQIVRVPLLQHYNIIFVINTLIEWRSWKNYNFFMVKGYGFCILNKKGNDNTIAE